MIAGKRFRGEEPLNARGVDAVRRVKELRKTDLAAGAQAILEHIDIDGRGGATTLVQRKQTNFPTRTRAEARVRVA